ncbi:energy-coupling factor transporter ATPase [Bacillus sp. FSL W7-1360]
MYLTVHCDAFQYPDTTKQVLTDVYVKIAQGERVAIVGGNGSGKSTFARLLNGLLIPTSGVVMVDGLDTKCKEGCAFIRSKVGFVFQNPDHQLVTSIVEDDIVFGLENAEWPAEQITERLQQVARQFGIEPLLKRSVHQLSGGQKQRVALAGVVALSPEVVVLDEVTSMLDPEGKAQVNACIDQLHAKGMTIISVTHDVQEMQRADRVLGFAEGQVVYDGTPEALFSSIQLVQKLQVTRPFVYELQEQLKQRGVHLPHCDREEALIEALWTYYLKM